MRHVCLLTVSTLGKKQTNKTPKSGESATKGTTCTQRVGNHKSNYQLSLASLGYLAVGKVKTSPPFAGLSD
jgi:hypothetical protein